MIKRILIFFLLGLTVSCQSKPQADDADKIAAQKKSDSLTEKIEQLQKKSQLPGLQAFVVNRGVTEFKYSKGLRAVGFDAAIEANDIFQLGVASKTITSILIAQLIDQKLLDWNSTVGSILTKQKMHASIKNITVEQLLGHTSGLIEPEKLKIWPTLYDKKYSTKRARELLVESILTSPAHYEKGKTPEYSNSGYIILGAIIEHMTNFPWEELAQNKILNVIGMKSCVFGFFGKETPEKPMQPWPHQWTGDAYKALTSENTMSDYPPAFAPAGNMRCNGEDWIKFLMELNYGLFKQSTFLSESTYAKLFNTANSQKINLAHFGVSEQMWGGGQVFYSFGAQETASAISTIVPRREIVLVVFTNAGDKNATRTSNQVLRHLKEYVEEQK